ncbi:MAG: cell wall hydrolase [Patescibacteria group bacterium]|nr:cell wall hydrolase [Patescibacteria group bacterium]
MLSKHRLLAIVAVWAKEPPIASRMVGYVTLKRAASNRTYWGGEDIVDVVNARRLNRKGKTVCQFSWTCGSAANKDPAEKQNWHLAVLYAQEVLAGSFNPPASSSTSPQSRKRKAQKLQKPRSTSLWGFIFAGGCFFG